MNLSRVSILEEITRSIIKAEIVSIGRCDVELR